MVSDHYEDLVKCGYLEVKLPRKHRKFGRKIWKRRWFILRRKSSQGSHRLEYFRSEDACLNSENKTIVSLETLKSIEKDSKSRTRSDVVKLVFSDTHLFIATDNKEENNMLEWVRLIKKFVLPDPKPTPITQRPDGSYPVTVILTDDSERLGLVGDFLLSISPEHIMLFRTDDGVHENGHPVKQWELDDIPRFRLQKLNHLNDAEKIFIINVARTSLATEGEYHFLTENGREILETVKNHTKQRSRNHDDSPRSSPLGAAVTSSNLSFGIDLSRSRSCSAVSHNSRQSTSDSSNKSTEVNVGS